MNDEWIKIGIVMYYRGSGPETKIIGFDELTNKFIIQESKTLFQMSKKEIMNENYVPWYAGSYFGFEY